MARDAVSLLVTLAIGIFCALVVNHYFGTVGALVWLAGLVSANQWEFNRHDRRLYQD